MVSNCYKQDRVWKKLEIDGVAHIICFIREDEEKSWKVLLTDLKEIWMENLTHETIFHKCQTLNPLLNLHEASEWKRSVLDMLSDIPQHVVEASVPRIDLRRKMDFVKLKFSLDLIKGTPQQFWQYVTEPLCLSSMELIRQHKILLDLVKRKDEEIAEYKAEGAELVRKYIATKPYSEELFRSDDADTTSADLVKTFQSMSDFYNTINLSGPQVKIKIEATSTTSNGARGSEVAKIDENAVASSPAGTYVETIKQEEPDKDEHSRDSTKEHLSSTSKAPIWKLNSTSYSISKSLKKNKKSLSDLI